VRYLANLCNDLGLKEDMHEYIGKLRKLQKQEDLPTVEEESKFELLLLLTMES
jgi:hypothetical protein